MNASPIVGRELRVRARQSLTYWIRCGLAAFAIIIGAQAVSSYTNTLSPGLIGSKVFDNLSWLAFLLACISCLATADCISSERREGTLGLLFLTDLEGRDVVLGKLTALGLSAFYGLVGFLPALALSVLAGGVSGGQYTRTALALLNALFLSLVAGLFISSRTHQQFRAMRNTLITVGLFFAWSWVTANLKGVPPMKAALFGLLSPYGAYYLAPDTSYATAPAVFWVALVVEHAAGWFLLAATNRDLMQKWRVAEKPEEPVRLAKMQPAPGQPGATVEASDLADDAAAQWPEASVQESWALLEQEPVCWAVSRTQGHNFYVWAGALLLLLSAAGTPLLTGPLWNALEFLASFSAGCLLSWGAGRSIFEARRSGELELLLCTPLGARDIVRGHWWALWRPLRAAWLLAVFVLLVQFIFSLGAIAQQPVYVRTFFVLWAVLVPLNKILDGVAICWVAMWFALQARKAIQVVAWTTGLVILLPYVIVSLLSFLAPYKPPAGTVNPTLILIPLLVLAKNVFFTVWAAGRLRAELRTTAPLGTTEWVT
jgi:ABC-type transport system involved in multi-copper enzyme maturation permease subunit